MKPARLILVGGFLGAGKTTLLVQAAGRLFREGKRVGVITNDQSAELVDSALLRQKGFDVAEVSGGCFCCHFNELAGAIEQLACDHCPDVIFAEPVGSCTDLSATVLQPLKSFYANSLVVAPFSVLVDPSLLRECPEVSTAGSFSHDIDYIVHKQMEEADLLVVNKIDRLGQEERGNLMNWVSARFGQARTVHLSALSGEGVDQWLKLVSTSGPAGRRVVDVNYDRYAEGEAALGWLNATVQLRAALAINWKQFCSDLLTEVEREIRNQSGTIAHVKLLLNGADGYVLGNVTCPAGSQPRIQGEVGTTAEEVLLVFNARAQIDSDRLYSIFERALRRTAGPMTEINVITMTNFSPARPRPTHRFNHVV